jgi:hypothetical protein
MGKTPGACLLSRPQAASFPKMGSLPFPSLPFTYAFWVCVCSLGLRGWQGCVCQGTLWLDLRALSWGSALLLALPLTIGL